MDSVIYRIRNFNILICIYLYQNIYLLFFMAKTNYFNNNFICLNCYLMIFF